MGIMEDQNDVELKGIFGNRYVDETEMLEPPMTNAELGKEVKFVPVGKNEKVVPTFKRGKAAWVERGKHIGWMFLSAGLNLLVFSWQGKGLMDASIATPCMWAAMAITGYHVCRIIASLECEV